MVMMEMRIPSRFFVFTFRSARGLLGTIMTDAIKSNSNYWNCSGRAKGAILARGSVKFVQTSCRISVPGRSLENKENSPSNFLKDGKMVPNADPPSFKDVNLLHRFFDQSTKLVVLTGAGISTECGIPDYRSPNGAYSTGFKPITHQEFLRSSRARRRYWARSYAGWRRFTSAQPGAAHIALASLERSSRIRYMITQNVDRLHHRAGSCPLELHGTVYTVGCVDCGFSFPRDLFQDQVKALNPKWAVAIESLDYDSRSDKSFGMKQRPDGDIEIDEKFWEDDFQIPPCPNCNGVLKPESDRDAFNGRAQNHRRTHAAKSDYYLPFCNDRRHQMFASIMKKDATCAKVVFFGDNVPKDKADKAMEAAKGCDSFLVLGSSVMTMSAFRLVRAAHEAGAATAIVNIGVTRADNFVSLKINARLGEILPRILNIGSLSIPAP